jgi:hypothetical protein
MKTLKFNSKSWHYWLATKIGDFYPEGGDFCSYIRHVILGALVSLFLVAAATFMLYALGREVYAAYTCWFTSVCTFGKFESAVATMACIAAALSAFIGLAVWYSNYRMRVRREIRNGLRSEPQPGFVKVAYKSVKGKTCFKVEFK